MAVTRRQFLAAGGAAGLGLALSGFSPASPAFAAAKQSRQSPPGALRPAKTIHYGDWKDIYRQKWTWDKVVKSSHFTNCWYQAHCSWNVYVKDNVVWREEQVAAYPQTNDKVSDFNPRGCQKGACFSERMYDPARVTYPLKRVGPRGSGKWTRVSWDEALSDLAGEFVRVMTEEGSDRVIWDNGPLYTFGAMAAAQGRFSHTAGNISLDMNTEIGDGHRGAGETFGKIVFERSADDYFYSDLIIIWGCNPLATQIPNAHFLTEARYNGAKLVTVAPDYSPSSIHSDMWVPVKPGSDAALALAVAKILIDEKLYDEGFVKEQTDLPILVRDDNGSLLRESDLKRNGSEDVFYFYDNAKGKIVEVGSKTLKLGKVDPALEGSFEVKTTNGLLSVRPVFERLRERLAGYSLEAASKMCGTPPAVIEKFARVFAAAKSATNVTSSNFSKYYHGNLIERSQALLFALGGHIGKKGGGFVAFPFITNDGFDMFTIGKAGLMDTAKLYMDLLPKSKMLQWKGYSDEMVALEMSRMTYPKGEVFACGTLFWAIHGGLLEYSGRSAEWDPYMKRPLDEYLKESLDKNWQYVWPKPGNDPRMLFVFGSNPLRRVRAYPLLLKTLWPKLTKVTVIDWRMTSTGQFADYVLPIEAWYERNDHKWGTTLAPFLHTGEKAVDTGQAWHEWKLFSRFAKHISETAKRRGLDKYTDMVGNKRSLAGFYDEFSYRGKFGEDAGADVAAEIVRRSTNLKEEFSEIQKKGFSRFTGTGGSSISITNATDIKENETITPLTDHVQKKQVYPTVTRRIQFYIDHPFYLELDEALPRHKDTPIAGGNYPLLLTGGHTRWSIHAQWRDDKLMLQQQRGVPVMYMSVEDAAARSIDDGDDVVVSNDLDSFTIQAKVSPALRTGQTIIYHAWENYQFAEGKGFQNLIPTPLNPVELSGGQFHLRPVFISMQPGHFDRDTRIEVRKV